MTQIILARHGETEWNVSEIFRGRADIELSENGKRQAVLLAEYLSDAKIDAVYSSPLRRALTTAEEITGYHNLKVRIGSSLIDFDYGRWQGLSLKQVRDRFPALYATWISHPDRVTMPGGESLDDVRERAAIMVDEVIARHNGTVVLVAHRVVNKVLICALLGLDNSRFWQIRQDTGGITTFNYENERFILTGHNDTSFLRSLPISTPRDF